MPVYVNLTNLTEQGMRNYQDTVDRAAAYSAIIEKAGGRVLQEVWTLGQYDVVTVYEAPDDETAASLALRLGALGNVRVATLRGFTADEARKIIAKSR
jgi:uncharacterized protein with GYD domain